MTKSRSRFTATGWYYLVVLLFILAGSVLQQLNLLMLLFALMVFPLVWNWWVTRRCVAAVLPRRSAPACVRAGTEFRAAVQLRNRRRRGRCWSILVRDRLVRLSPQPQRYALVAWTLQVPARANVTIPYPPLRLPRGVYRWEELTLECRFPLGLIRSTRREKQEQSLVVYPAPGWLTQAWRARGGHRIHWFQGTRRRRSPLEGEFYGLRDYLPGDNRRWIHWRSSARREELIVRQFEESASRRLCVVLDLWAPQTAKSAEDDLQALEDLLSFVATVLEDQVRQNASGLWLIVAAGEVQEVRGPANADTLHRALALLAEAWPQRADSLHQIGNRGKNGWESQTELLVVSLAPQNLRSDKLNHWRNKSVHFLWVDPQTLPRYFLPQHRQHQVVPPSSTTTRPPEQHASATGGGA